MAKKKDKEAQKNWSHKNDYPIEEVWNTDNTLAQLIVGWQCELQLRCMN